MPIKRSHYSKPAALSLLLLLIAVLVMTTRLTTAQALDQNSEIEFYTQVYGREAGHVCELPFEPHSGGRESLPAPIMIPPDHLERMPRTANVIVNYSGDWSDEARNAFEYAVTIWEKLIQSPVTIEVDAAWASLGNGVLGGAGPTQYVRNFPGAPQEDVWYPIALANSLAGSDLQEGADIHSRFNSMFDWYFGTDANPPISQVDFVSVVLHELGHGLGFAGSFQATASIAVWGFSGFSGIPLSYDRFVENGAGASLISSFPNGSDTLRAQLTGNSVYFDGKHTTAANDGNRARLHAPYVWSRGSSISHLDNVYNETQNALMTFSVRAGVAEHAPGPITLGLFADIGWELSDTLTFGDGTIMLEAGTTADNAIDLWAFASDNSVDAELTFSIVEAAGNGVSVSLDQGRYLDVTATTVGVFSVDVMVTDPGQNSQTATFRIISAEKVSTRYLPTITGD